MSEVDRKLEAWSASTEAMQPSPELMARLSAVAAAAAAAPAPAAPGAGAKAAAAKAGVAGKIIVASIVGGLVVGGSVWGPELAKRWNLPTSVDGLLRLIPQVPGGTQVVVTTKTMKLTPEPAKVATAVGGLSATCAAQRAPLMALAESEAGRDPEATGAALARASLLCRKTKGADPATQAVWPWALIPQAARGGCDLAADPCSSGSSIAESIANAQRCIQTSPPGSCARRAARLKSVFAWCEQTIHAGPNAMGDFRKLGLELGALTQEFGQELGSAAWCQNPEAQAESMRLRHLTSPPPSAR
jgi:hypothetical protein